MIVIENVESEYILSTLICIKIVQILRRNVYLNLKLKKNKILKENQISIKLEASI